MDINYMSEDSDNVWPERPFLTSLYQPRSTIRAIVDSNPKKYVLLLALLAGIARNLSNASEIQPGSSLSLTKIFLFSIIGGGLLGLASIFIMGALFHFVSRFFWGVSTSAHVRAAIAWSSIPVITLLPLWVFKIVSYEFGYFSLALPLITLSSNSYTILQIIGFIMELWTFFLLLICLGEVNDFPIWLTFITLVLAYVILVFIFGFIGIFVVSFS